MAGRPALRDRQLSWPSSCLLHLGVCFVWQGQPWQLSKKLHVVKRGWGARSA